MLDPAPQRRQALRALAHPTTLAWVAVLLVNDHLLRWRSPGRLTGKLSDLAWLAIAPLALALVMAAAGEALGQIHLGRYGLGGRLRHQDPAGGRLVIRHRAGVSTIWLSIAAVGLVFAVVKGLPEATAIFRTAFRTLFGWTPLIVCDPTDLLALPALAFSWFRWQQASSEESPSRTTQNAAAQPPRRRPNRTSPSTAIRWRGWAALVIVALASLGNSGPPDEGIVCLDRQGDRILAGPRYGYAYTDTFASDDGGLTWTSLGSERTSVDEAMCPTRDDVWTVAGPLPGESLRFVAGRRIERSTDDGGTWTTVLSLTGEDARMAYYEVSRSNVQGSPGPHDAIIDPATENLILAMGHEGVLVRTAPGVWDWVTVGSYRFEPLRTPAQMLVLLQGELGLAIAAGFVCVAIAAWQGLRALSRFALGPRSAPAGSEADATASTPTPGSRLPWPLRLLVVLAAVGVGLAFVVVRPATISGYNAIVAGGVVIAALAVTLVLAAVLTYLLARAIPAAQRRRLLGLLGWLAATVLVVISPYIAWALGWLATYTPAAWIAVALATVVWLAAGIVGSGQGA